MHTDAQEIDSDREPYRAVSGWAIAAVLLGIASTLAFLAPVAWIVPLAGVVAALVAMRKIGNAPDQLIGRGAALLGLLLALLFGVGAVTRTYTRQHWIERRAEVFAREFARILSEENTYAAYQLTLQPRLRKPLGQDAEQAFANDPESRESYDAFCDRPAVQTLIEACKDRPAQIESVKFVGSDAAGDYVEVLVRVPPEQAGGLDGAVKLTLMRGQSSGDAERWRVISTQEE